MTVKYVSITIQSFSQLFQSSSTIDYRQGSHTRNDDLTLFQFYFTAYSRKYKLFLSVFYILIRQKSRNGGVSRISVPCEHLTMYARVMAWRITLFCVIYQSVCAAICNAFPCNAGFLSSLSALQLSIQKRDYRDEEQKNLKIANIKYITQNCLII